MTRSAASQSCPACSPCSPSRLQSSSPITGTQRRGASLAGRSVQASVGTPAGAAARRWAAIKQNGRQLARTERITAQLCRTDDAACALNSTLTYYGESRPDHVEVVAVPAKRPRLSAARKAAGHTQESLAEAIGVDRSTVVRWEAGETAPQPWVRPKLARLLGVTGSELGELLGTEVATSQPPSVDSPSVVSDAAAALHHLVPVAESVELLRQIEASDLGPGTLDQLEELVERLGFDYFAVPPTEFRTSVLSWRRYVARLLNGKLTLAQRRRLYAVAGWLSGLLAEVSLALGEQAAPHCVTALSLARESGDRRLAGWVLGTRAQIALYTGNPLHSVAFAAVGRQVAPQGSAALVRACAHEARTSARIGDRRSAEAALYAAKHAWSVLAQPPTRSIYSLGSSYLPYCSATTYVWLRQPKRARVHAERAVNICDAAGEPPVSRAIARIDLAIAMAHEAEPDAASLMGVAALDVCSARLTEPVRRRTGELLTALAPFPERYRTRVEERRTWTST